jgi:DNA polymerase-3 subunit epsilon
MNAHTPTEGPQKRAIRMIHNDSRQEAVRTAREILESRPVYLDTETTGLGPGSQIIEICVLDSDGSVLIDRLVRPSIPIPSDASRVHGIRDAMVAGEPSWAEVWPEVEQASWGRPIAIYNAAYDLARMRQSHRAHGLDWREPSGPVHCLMKLYARYHGEWDPNRRAFRWVSLEQAARRCGILLPQRHRARQDAELAQSVLECVAADLRV